jgi:hypothetical protein
VRPVGVCPSRPEALARLRGELGVGFPLVSDPSETLVQALCGGVSHCAVLVDAEGVVRWGTWTETWSEGPSAVQVLQSAYRMKR